jgi:hypothetical protein
VPLAERVARKEDSSAKREGLDGAAAFGKVRNEEKYDDNIKK